MPKTWRELEAEGIKRCCAHFTNGKQCRRRQLNNAGGWCDRHAPIFDRIAKETMAIVEAERDGKHLRCDED